MHGGEPKPEEMSQLYYRRTDSSSYRDRIPLRIVRAESELSPLEKAYLGAVEKGDYASVKQALEVCAVPSQCITDVLITFAFVL